MSMQAGSQDALAFCLQEVHSFAKTDPYVLAGLVLDYTVKPYQILVAG